MFKKKLRVIVFVALFGLTVVCAGATLMKLGAQDASNPKGISLREESRRAPHGYGFFYIHSRSHVGGGPSYGK